MKIEDQDESITNAVNSITQKLGHIVLEEFLKLPKELQMNIILIKSSQLLLANILCHVASTKVELEHIADAQGTEIKELTLTCAFSGFAGKFDISNH